MKTMRIETNTVIRRRDGAKKKQIVFVSRQLTRRIFDAVNRFFIFAVLFTSLLTFACTPRSFEKSNDAAVSSPMPEDKQANFQNELEKMRTANLQYIFAFRRKDGGIFDSEDKRYLRSNLPFNNRVVLADEDKAVIVGSNYKFPPENLNGLQMRFNVEDYSAAEQAK